MQSPGFNRVNIQTHVDEDDIDPFPAEFVSLRKERPGRSERLRSNHQQQLEELKMMQEKERDRLFNSQGGQNYSKLAKVEAQSYYKKQVIVQRQNFDKRESIIQNLENISSNEVFSFAQKIYKRGASLLLNKLYHPRGEVAKSQDIAQSSYIDNERAYEHLKVHRRPGQIRNVSKQRYVSKQHLQFYKHAGELGKLPSPQKEGHAGGIRSGGNSSSALNFINDEIQEINEIDEQALDSQMRQAKRLSVTNVQVGNHGQRPFSQIYDSLKMPRCSSGAENTRARLVSGFHRPITGKSRSMARLQNKSMPQPKPGQLVYSHLAKHLNPQRRFQKFIENKQLHTQLLSRHAEPEARIESPQSNSDYAQNAQHYKVKGRAPDSGSGTQQPNQNSKGNQMLWRPESSVQQNNDFGSRMSSGQLSRHRRPYQAALQMQQCGIMVQGISPYEQPMVHCQRHMNQQMVGVIKQRESAKMSRSSQSSSFYPFSRQRGEREANATAPLAGVNYPKLERAIDQKKTRNVFLKRQQLASESLSAEGRKASTIPSQVPLPHSQERSLSPPQQSHSQSPSQKSSSVSLEKTVGSQFTGSYVTQGAAGPARSRLVAFDLSDILKIQKADQINKNYERYKKQTTSNTQNQTSTSHLNSQTSIRDGNKTSETSSLPQVLERAGTSQLNGEASSSEMHSTLGGKPHAAAQKQDRPGKNPAELIVGQGLVGQLGSLLSPKSNVTGRVAPVLVTSGGLGGQTGERDSESARDTGSVSADPRHPGGQPSAREKKKEKDAKKKKGKQKGDKDAKDKSPNEREKEAEEVEPLSLDDMLEIQHHRLIFGSRKLNERLDPGFKKRQRKAETRNQTKLHTQSLPRFQQTFIPALARISSGAANMFSAAGGSSQGAASQKNSLRQQPHESSVLNSKARLGRLKHLNDALQGIRDLKRTVHKKERASSVAGTSISRSVSRLTEAQKIRLEQRRKDMADQKKPYGGIRRNEQLFTRIRLDGAQRRSESQQAHDDHLLAQIRDKRKQILYEVKDVKEELEAMTEEEEEVMKKGLREHEQWRIKREIRKSWMVEKKDCPPNLDFYRLGVLIGRGAFGKVNLALHKLTWRVLAVKSVSIKLFEKEKQCRLRVSAESRFWPRLKHRNIVKLFERHETGSHYLYLMELCQGGDLLNYVRKRRRLKEDVAKFLFRQIVVGLGYLHNQNLIHKDIKLENILLDNEGVVKIGDFGISREGPTVEIAKSKRREAGTLAYMAPELLEPAESYGPAVDIWAAGVVLYIMIFGCLPFKGKTDEELRGNILTGNLEFKDDICGAPCRNLIEKLLVPNPTERLLPIAILRHQWLAGTDAQTVVPVFNDDEKEVISQSYIFQELEVDRTRKVELDEQDIPRGSLTGLSVGGTQITQLYNEEGFAYKYKGEEEAAEDRRLDLNDFAADVDSLLNSTQDPLERNMSTKSAVYGPYNSMRGGGSAESEEQEPSLHSVREEGTNRFLGHGHQLNGVTLLRASDQRMISFDLKVKATNRRYEDENNQERDNGVYNQLTDDSQNEKSVKRLRSLKKKGRVKSEAQQLELNLHGDEKIEGFQQEEQQELAEFQPDDYRKLDPKGQVVRRVVRFGYPLKRVREFLNSGASNHCTATYYLLLKDQEVMM